MFMARFKNNLEKYPCMSHSSNCSVLCISEYKSFVLPLRDCLVDFLEVTNQGYFKFKELENLIKGCLNLFNLAPRMT